LLKGGGGFTVPQARTYTREIAEGIRYLHSLNMVHRDLKLDNIFLSFRGVCRIGDFGLAREVVQEGVASPSTARMKTAAAASADSCTLEKARGHKVYRSPEACKKGTVALYSDDCWALGIIVTEMATQRTAIQRMREAVNALWPVHFEEQIMEEMLQETRARDAALLAPVAEALLEHHPMSRFTAEQIIGHFFQPLVVPRESSVDEQSGRQSQQAFDAHQFMMEEALHVDDGDGVGPSANPQQSRPESLPDSAVCDARQQHQPVLRSERSGGLGSTSSGLSLKLTSLKHAVNWPAWRVEIRGIDELVISFLDVYRLGQYAPALAALGFRDQLDLALGLREKKDCRELAQAIGMKHVHALKFEQKWRENFYSRRPRRTKELMDVLVQRAESSEGHGLDYWLKAVRLESYGPELRAQGVDSVDDLRNYVTFVFRGSGGVGRRGAEQNTKSGLRARNRSNSSNSVTRWDGPDSPPNWPKNPRELGEGLLGLKIGSVGSACVIETSNKHDERRFDIALRKRELLSKSGMLLTVAEEERATKRTAKLLSPTSQHSGKSKQTLSNVMQADTAAAFAAAIGDMVLPGQSVTSSDFNSREEGESGSSCKNIRRRTENGPVNHMRVRSVTQKLVNGLITQAEHDEILTRSREFDRLNSKFQLNLRTESPGALMAGEVFQRRNRRWLKAFGKTWRVAHLDLSQVGSDGRNGLELKVWRGGRGTEEGDLPETIMRISCDVRAESCIARPKKNSQGVVMRAWHIVDSDGAEINTTGTAKLFPMACTKESEARQWIQAINHWCAETLAWIEEQEQDLEAPGALPATSMPRSSVRTPPRRSSFRRQSLILHDASLGRLRSPSSFRKTKSQKSPAMSTEGLASDQKDSSWHNLSQSGGQQRRRNSIMKMLEDELNNSVGSEEAGWYESDEFSTDDGLFAYAYDSPSLVGPVDFGRGARLSILSGFAAGGSPPQSTYIRLEAERKKGTFRVATTGGSTPSTRILCHDKVSCTFFLKESNGDADARIDSRMASVCKILDSATLESNFGIPRSNMTIPPLHVLEPLREHMQLIYGFGIWESSDEDTCGVCITRSSSLTEPAVDVAATSTEEGTMTKTGMLKVFKEWCSGGSLCDLIGWTIAERLDAIDTVMMFSISLMNALVRNHNAGLVHGAMRLSNMFLASRGEPTSLRVGGLCVSRWMRSFVAQELPVDYPGTLYLAPEEAETKTPSGLASVDMWQAGVLMLQIALQEDWESECKGAYQPVKPGIVYEYLDRLRAEVDPNRPHRIIALIKRCLDPNPKRRPTALEAQKLIIGATGLTLARQEMHAAMVDEMLLTVELEEPLDEKEALTDDIQMCSSAGLSEVKVLYRRSTEPSLDSGSIGSLARSQNSYHKRKKLGSRSMSSADPDVAKIATKEGQGDAVGDIKFR
jgi:serine/threonine protein kinase